MAYNWMTPAEGVTAHYNRMARKRAADRADRAAFEEAYKQGERQAKADTPQSALDVQIGGNHYKQGGLDPMKFSHANDLGFAEGNVVKYVTRHRRKNGKQDLEKAIHCLQILIELEYPNG